MLEWRPSTISDVKWRLESHLLRHVGDLPLSAFDITRITAVKTTLLKESRRKAGPSTTSSTAVATGVRTPHDETSV